MLNSDIIVVPVCLPAREFVLPAREKYLNESEVIFNLYYAR